MSGRTRNHSTRLGLAFLGLVLGLGASAASAQNVLVGGPGDTFLHGTNQSDDLSDPTGGDMDVVFDSPGIGPPDGAFDHLSTVDGDNKDFMHGGPEDSFVGDPGDYIVIMRPIKGQPAYWKGTYAEYRFIRRLYLWLRDALTAQPLPGAAPQGDFWIWAFQSLIDQLAEAQPQGETHDLVALFPVEGFEGPLPWSPANFLHWFPAHPQAEPEPQLIATADELSQAITDLQEILASLQTLPASEGADGGGDGDGL